MGELKNFINAWLIVIASLCYSYLLASKIPKGILRLISLLPIFSLFTLLPLSLSTPFSTFIFGAFITWISNFKLLLYSFNLGPLSSNHHHHHHHHHPVRSRSRSRSRSLLMFIFLAAFPINIKVKPSKSQQKGNFGIASKKVLPLTFWSKCVLFVVLDVVYYSFNKNMVVLCCLMYLFIDITFGVCGLFVGSTLGLELQPPSDEPYLSTSLQNFWGKRWNLMVSDALRHTIYKPVRSAAGNYVGHRWAPVLGVMASFVVSGLMHELIYYYATRVEPTWEVTQFFVLHGVCVVLEMAVKRGLGQKWRLHWAISGPLTVGFVLITGLWLFFPQLMRNRVDVRANEDFIEFGKFLKQLVII